jgi:hypothetical protein
MHYHFLYQYQYSNISKTASIGSSLIPPNCSNKNYNQSLLSLTTMSSMYVYCLCTVYLFSYYLYTQSKISFINIQSNRYIVSVVPNQPWWDLACKIPTCNKRTKPHGDAYKCSNLLLGWSPTVGPTINWALDPRLDQGAQPVLSGWWAPVAQLY